MHEIIQFYDRLGLKQQQQPNQERTLKNFIKSLNHRYSLNPQKALMFEESFMLYIWFLTNPNIEEGEISRVLSYINERYLFSEYPEVMGCIMGGLIIYRIENPLER